MAYNPFNAASGIVENKRKWANAKAKGEDTKPYEEGAAAYYKELRDNGRGDVADYLQKSDSITAGEYLKQLQPEYGVDAASLQKKSDDVYNWTKGIGGQLNKDYDMVYQTIGVTPTRTDYGKDILGGYGLAAEGAYKGTLGGASGDNGGNVDSYAAAQANRNKADMVKEGYGTVLDYYNSIAGNATNWANSKAGALGGFAGMLQDNVNSDRDVLKTAYNGSVDMFKTKYTADSALAEKGLELSGNIYGTQVDAMTKTYTDKDGNVHLISEKVTLPEPKLYGVAPVNYSAVTTVPYAAPVTSDTVDNQAASAVTPSTSVPGASQNATVSVPVTSGGGSSGTSNGGAVNAYNPYDDVKSIVNYKNQWAKATANGEDASQYANAAVLHYNNLRANGRSDIADYLQNANADTAANYFTSFSKNGSVDNTQQQVGGYYYYPHDDVEKIVGYKILWEEAAAKGEDTKPYEQRARYYYNKLRENGRSDVADYLEGADASTASIYLGNFEKRYQPKKGSYGVSVGIYGLPQTETVASEVVPEVAPEVLVPEVAPEVLVPEVAPEVLVPEVAPEVLVTDIPPAEPPAEPSVTSSAADYYNSLVSNEVPQLNDVTPGPYRSMLPNEIDEEVERLKKQYGTDTEGKIEMSQHVINSDDYTTKDKKQMIESIDYTPGGSNLKSPLLDNNMNVAVNNQLNGYTKPEAIQSAGHLKIIDDKLKTLKNNKDKAQYIVTIAGNLGLTEGNLVWLANRYNIDLQKG